MRSAVLVRLECSDSKPVSVSVHAPAGTVPARARILVRNDHPRNLIKLNSPSRAPLSIAACICVCNVLNRTDASA